MVFESLVTDLVNRFLGDFIENLDKSQLKLGIWGGLLPLVDTTSNIGVSLISLHHTPRPHTLNRVIRNLMRLAHI